MCAPEKEIETASELRGVLPSVNKSCLGRMTERKKRVFPVSFWYEEEFLQTPKYKTRYKRPVRGNGHYSVDEVDEGELPVACILPSRSGETIEFRHMDGSFWMKVDVADFEKGPLGGVYSDGYVGTNHASKSSGFIPGTSMPVGGDREDRLADVQKAASRYIILGHEFWVMCGEPYFKVSHSGDTMIVSIRFADGDAARMTGLDVWSVTDFALLFKRLVLFQSRHPSISVSCPPLGECRILMPEAFRFGEEAKEAVAEDPARFLSRPFRDMLTELHNREYGDSTFESVLLDRLSDAIMAQFGEMHELPYHACTKAADEAFCSVMEGMARAAKEKTESDAATA